MQSHPAVGWIRADDAAESMAAAEILRSKTRIEELEAQLREARLLPPPGSEGLSQGHEKYTVEFAFFVWKEPGTR